MLTPLDAPDFAFSKFEIRDEGPPNYITPAGLQTLKDELDRMRYQERPQIVSTIHWSKDLGEGAENPEASEAMVQLNALDHKIQMLEMRIGRSRVVDPTKPHRRDRVQFGAIVTYSASSDDSERIVTIVGIDEIDRKAQRISWTSPIGRALLGKSEGDIIEVVTPKGQETIEIVSIDYPTPNQNAD